MTAVGRGNFRQPGRRRGTAEDADDAAARPAERLKEKGRLREYRVYD